MNFPCKILHFLTPSVSRPASTPVVEGTSVAPRQRPKGSQAPPPGVGSLTLLPQATPNAAKRLTPTTPHGKTLLCN